MKVKREKNHRYRVTVHTERNPDWPVEVQAEDEWKARTRAMVYYPYALKGDFVEYSVELLTGAPEKNQFQAQATMDFSLITKLVSELCLQYGIKPEDAVYVDDTIELQLNWGRAEIREYVRSRENF